MSSSRTSTPISFAGWGRDCARPPVSPTGCGNFSTTIASFPNACANRWPNSSPTRSSRRSDPRSPCSELHCPSDAKPRRSRERLVLPQPPCELPGEPLPRMQHVQLEDDGEINQRADGQLQQKRTGTAETGHRLKHEIHDRRANRDLGDLLHRQWQFVDL